MRLPRATFQILLAPVVCAILFVSISSVRASNENTAHSSALSPSEYPIIFTPASLHFENVAVGLRQAQTVAVTNAGNSRTTLLQVVTTGNDFTLDGLDLPLTLEKGESFTFSVVFAPRSRGTSYGSVAFVADVSGTASAKLLLELASRGPDDYQLIVDPATMDFGTVTVGSAATQPGNLIAAGDAVTIISAISSSLEFTVNGLSFPLTIPAGGSQAYSVMFTPQTDAAVTATLSFFSDDGSFPTTESLIGKGADSSAHGVDLSWNASTSQDVIGYNIYRGITPGGPYTRINSALDAGTFFTDTSVISGGIYYYVTTAVDSSRRESVYSNEAQAIIPLNPVDRARPDSLAKHRQQ